MLVAKILWFIIKNYKKYYNLVIINLINMYLLSFETSQWDEYNELKIMKIQSLDQKIFVWKNLNV
jgi:hypothetical protein